MGYLLDNCLFARLTADIVDQCLPFQCSKDSDIDSFSHNGTKDNYSDYNKEMMGYSHCFYTDSPIPEMVCAFSLSHTALRTAPLPNNRKNRFNKSIPNNKRRSQYPAILIGQLCVFDKFSHMNIGEEMLDLIKTLAIEETNNCAARYLVVDAVNNPKVLSFYKDNGFQFLFSSDTEELECLHNIAKETSFRKLKRFFTKQPLQIAKCKTRLMYFDLILLSTKS